MKQFRNDVWKEKYVIYGIMYMILMIFILGSFTNAFYATLQSHTNDYNLFELTTVFIISIVTMPRIVNYLNFKNTIAKNMLPIKN